MLQIEQLTKSLIEFFIIIIIITFCQINFSQSIF
jgi:hypothetical protein